MKAKEFDAPDLLALMKVGAPIVIQNRYGCGLKMLVNTPYFIEEP